MTEAPAAMANLYRERPTAELTGPVVCIPRRKDILATPFSILRIMVEVKVNRESDAADNSGGIHIT